MASPGELPFVAHDLSALSSFYGVLPLDPSGDIVKLYLQTMPNLIDNAADTVGSLDTFTVRPSRGNLVVDPRIEQVDRAFSSDDPASDELRIFNDQTSLLLGIASAGFTLASIDYSLSAGRLETFNIALHDIPRRPTLYEIAGVRDDDSALSDDDAFVYEFSEYDTTSNQGPTDRIPIDTKTALELTLGAARCAGLRDEKPPIEAVLAHIFNNAENRITGRSFYCTSPKDSSKITATLEHTISTTHPKGKTVIGRRASYLASVEYAWPNRDDITTKLTLGKKLRQPPSLTIEGVIKNDQIPEKRWTDFEDIYKPLFNNPTLALEIITGAVKKLSDTSRS